MSRLVNMQNNWYKDPSDADRRRRVEEFAEVWKDYDFVHDGHLLVRSQGLAYNLSSRWVVPKNNFASLHSVKFKGTDLGRTAKLIGVSFVSEESCEGVMQLRVELGGLVYGITTQRVDGLSHDFFHVDDVREGVPLLAFERVPGSSPGARITLYTMQSACEVKVSDEVTLRFARELTP